MMEVEEDTTTSMAAGSAGSDELEEELLHQVFLASGMRFTHLRTLALVCRRWRDAVRSPYFRQQFMCGETLLMGEASFGESMVFDMDKHKSIVNRVPCLDGERVTNVALGLNWTVAELEDQRIVSFGYNAHGQLGVGDDREKSDEMTPIISFARRIKVTSLCGGYLHVILIDDQGQAFSWGSGRYGRLGHGDTNDVRTPKKIAALSDHFAVHGTASRCSLVVTREGEVFGFGFGSDGQLGTGDELVESNPLPRRVDMGGVPVRSAHAGFAHSFFITHEGSVYGCGKASFGRLGLDMTPEESKGRKITKPVLITGPLEGKNVVSVASSMLSSFFLTDKGEVYFTGVIRKCQAEADALRPERVRGGDFQNKRAVAIACGFHYACILTEEGQVLVMGESRGITPDGKYAQDPLVVPQLGWLAVRSITSSSGRIYMIL